MKHFIGPRGSGKTYWAIQQALYQDAVLVCRDPRTITSIYEKEFEKLPGMMSFAEYIAALSDIKKRHYLPFRVVIDDIDALCKIPQTTICAFTQGDDYDTQFINDITHMDANSRYAAEFEKRYYKWGNKNESN